MTARGAKTVRFLTGTVAWVGLASAVWAAYAPSLRQTPRWDQWWYLADTYGHDEFVDLLSRTYSWNRTCPRIAFKRDTGLFRPVLFAVLAAEKAWLDPRQELVQAVGVVLHMAVCALAYCVLRELHRAARRRDIDGGPTGAASAEERGGGPFPSASAVLSFAATAFFALSPFVLMKVVWAHIHGYLLFDALLLAALLAELKRIGASGSRRTRLLWTSWGLLAVAGFTYEMGQFAAVLFALHALAVRSAAGDVGAGVRAGLLFLAIPILYQVASREDLRVHLAAGSCGKPNQEVWAARFLRNTPESSAKYLVYTTLQPWIPGAFESTHDPAEVVGIPETLWGDLTDPVRRSWWRIAALGCLLAAAAAVAVRIGRSGTLRDGTRAATAALCVALYALYAGIIVVGRWNPRPDYVVAHSYVTYFALLSFLIAVQAAATGAFPVDRRGNLARLGLAAVLLALAAYGSSSLHDANVAATESFDLWRRQSLALRSFVREHESEPGFSFEVDTLTSLPVLIDDDSGIETHTLHCSRWTSQTPPGTARYVVTFQGDRVLVRDRSAGASP